MVVALQLVLCYYQTCPQVTPIRNVMKPSRPNPLVFFTPITTMQCCKDCKHFKDGRMSRTWITPRCTVLGDDAATYMRRKVCGIDEPKHWEPKTPDAVQASAAMTQDGAVRAKDS